MRLAGLARGRRQQEAPIDPHDIAAVAVAALTSSGHEGKIYELTGPEALTTAEMVAKISKAIDKPIQCIDTPEAAARSGMFAQGTPGVLVEAVLELMALIRGGLRRQTDEHRGRGPGPPGPRLRRVAARPRGRLPVARTPPLERLHEQP